MNDLDLDKCRRHLHSNTPLIAGWLQERAIEFLVQDASAEAIRLLEEAVVDFADDDRGDDAFSASLVLLKPAIHLPEKLCAGSSFIRRMQQPFGKLSLEAICPMRNVSGRCSIFCWVAGRNMTLSISTATCFAKLIGPPILSCAIAWQPKHGAKAGWSG